MGCSDVIDAIVITRRHAGGIHSVNKLVCVKMREIGITAPLPRLANDELTGLLRILTYRHYLLLLVFYIFPMIRLQLVITYINR